MKKKVIKIIMTAIRLCQALGQGRSAKFSIFARWHFRHAALSQITTASLKQREK